MSQKHASRVLPPLLVRSNPPQERLTTADLCHSPRTLPIPSRRKDQHWGTIEEAHRQMAMLSLRRRLGIPANSTAYDEVMTERYLRADLSRTESRVGEFKRHGRFDGTTARFGLEILWEHSPVPFEDIQGTYCHLNLVQYP
ncbi:hypothetical protein FRB91_007755 [Serendipita sp. 411]|nr:hypothetical protein FRC15_000187 [Serendipita sp. 397]KAG8792210.1 hypothetical protein FRC16_011498 [Serendipita sp. 398]KAG8838189.1 hypothetical protein FRB91_007755 [Serendipita sp. 411]